MPGVDSLGLDGGGSRRSAYSSGAHPGTTAPFTQSASITRVNFTPHRRQAGYVP